MMNWSETLRFNDLEKQNGLPSGILNSIMRAESSGNPKAVSPAGAQGLFQFMPDTAKAYGIDPLDPQQAAAGAAKMLADLHGQYDGDLPQVLAAYNWGSGNLREKGLENAPRETRDYIQKVSAALGAQQAEIGQSSSDKLLGQSANDELVDMEMPDGSIMEGVPANLTNEQIKTLYSKFTPSVPVNIPENNPAPDAGKMSALRAFGLGVGQGATFGTSDEIVGMVGGDKDKMRAGLSLARKEYPLTTIAGDMVGGLATGGLAYGAAKRLAAPALAAITKFAKASPVLSSVIAGGASGALRGAGEGVDKESRLEGAGIGGAAGGVLGGLAGTLLGSLSKPINQAAAVIKEAPDKVEKTFNRFGKTAVDKSDDLLDDAAGAIDDTVKAATELKPGAVFPLTAGQKTQNVTLQALEEDALKGRLNIPSNAAPEEAALATKAIQNKSFHGYINKLAGADLSKVDDVNTLIDNVYSTLQSQYGAQKQSVDAAYKLAKEGKGVKIGIDDLRQGLFGEISKNTKEFGLDFNNNPNSASAIQKLAEVLRVRDGGELPKLTAVKLNALEGWRTLATRARENAVSSDKKFMGETIKIYDDFMRKTAANAADAGDEKAIMAFREAVSKRAEMGRLFEKNDLVENIAKGTKSVDDVVKDFVGAGAIGGKRQMAENLQAVLDAAGDNKESVRSTLQTAFMKRIADKFTSFEADNPMVKQVDAGVLARELNDLFVKNKQFARELYGKEAAIQAKEAINDLMLISKKQAGVVNPSETSTGLYRVLSRIPQFGQMFKDLGAMEQNRRLGEKAVRSLSDKLRPQELKDVAKSVEQPTNEVWRSWFSGASVPATYGASSEPLNVRIYKKKGEK